MNDKEWQKMGKDILNVVQDAISSGNYQQLNEQVKQVVDSTVDGLRGTGQTLRSEMQNRGKTGDNPGWRQEGRVPVTFVKVRLLLREVPREWEMCVRRSSFRLCMQKNCRDRFRELFFRLQVLRCQRLRLCRELVRGY